MRPRLRKSDLKPPSFKRLRIGAYDWTVEWVPGYLEGGDQGQQHDHAHALTIGLNGTPANVANTLLHEVLHAIFATTALGHAQNMSKELEEFIVRALTEGLLQVVRDNPQFVLALVGLLGKRA